MTSIARPEVWVAADIRATALFSLRPATTTSAGGRTLPLPTPYAVKMALLDAAFHADGPAAGAAIFPVFREAAVALLPSERVTVTNTFQRVLKMARSDSGGKADDEAAEEVDNQGGSASGPLANTLGYRELAFLHGPFVIAIGLRDPCAVSSVASLLWRVNYLGRRGGFVQVMDVQTDRPFDPRWTVVDPSGWQPEHAPNGDLAVPLDDFGPQATLDTVNPFSPKPAKANRDRVTHYRILPLKRCSSSRVSTEYRLVASLGSPAHQ